MLKSLFTKAMVLTLVLALAVVFAPKMEANAATQGDIDGTFTSTGYNNPTDFDTAFLKIYAVNPEAPTGDGTLTTNLMPQGYYYMEFQLDDLDGYEDLALEIRLFDFESESRTAGEIEAAFDAIGARDNSTAFETQPDSLSIDWSATYVADAFSSETFTTLVDGTNAITGNTWEISPTYSDGTTALDSASAATSTGTDEYARTFRIYFVPSKVAPFSSNGEWVVGVNIIDSLNGEGNETETFKYVDGYSMQYYGEVQVATDIDEVTEGDQAPVIDWSSVAVGMDYDHVDAVEQVVGLTYISNAAYAERVKASETWEADAGNQFSTDATLSANPTGGNEFALKAANTGTYGTADTAQINHLSFVTIGDQKARTTEQGFSPSIFIYLSLSSSFQNGTYAGTVTFGITNWAELI